VIATATPSAFGSFGTNLKIIQTAIEPKLAAVRADVGED